MGDSGSGSLLIEVCRAPSLTPRLPRLTDADVYFDPEANRAAYEYWRDSVRPRIKDPRKRDILAPQNPPHAFGCKRPSLEQRYFEIYNQDHVDVVDIEQDPIEEITESGIRLRSGDHRAFDVIALATGFDAVNGSLGNLNIRNAKGETIGDHWKSGLRTSCGVALAGFPNMFFLYGPQAPTAFSNGPTTCHVQAEFLGELFEHIQKEGIKRIEATDGAEKYWTDETHKYWDRSLFSTVRSWYDGESCRNSADKALIRPGGNVPGKKVEPLNYIGGIPQYIKELKASMPDNRERWNVVSASA